MNMILTLDYESALPIYIQLRNKIIEGIASGRLKPGDPLPSVRALARDLGVNMHTVNKAYQLLKQEGFLSIHRQKGVVIHPDGFPPASERFLERLKEDLRPLVSESVCRGLSEEEFLSVCAKIFREIQKGGEPL
ncbi:hypothetical protein B4135_0870 [Caldibacillus debilis]|uniref:HTH gntR-type domain-containing protein n=2 Tax=Caldibacillus debilis TaxID=301148 RepID=A0A150M6I2_9BACI|nr:hypothetical protein B4135_0870 [Caldibacillus debilis]